MYTRKYLNYRILVAKDIARLYCDPSDTKRCLTRIHGIYVEPILGVEYDTFRNYVGMSGGGLGDMALPGYVRAALLMLGYFRECERMGIPMPDFDKYRPEPLERYLGMVLRRREEIRMRIVRSIVEERALAEPF